VYVVAGHRAIPRRPGIRGTGSATSSGCAPGRGTLEKEKPPVFGVIQRTGEVAIRMLADVKQRTTGTLIRATIAPESTVYTDAYDIYPQLPECGYAHRTVRHSQRNSPWTRTGPARCTST
jgi:transposase-like protein